MTTSAKREGKMGPGKGNTKRLDLYLAPDDYDFLGWMIHHYKARNRSTAARVCIKAMREWMRLGNTPDTTPPK